MSRFMILIVFSFLATACTTEGDPQGRSQAKTEKFCTEELALGSHIKQRKCRSAEDYERETRQAKETLSTPNVTSDGAPRG